MSDEETPPIGYTMEDAVKLYWLRSQRVTHPDGNWDSAGVWKPSALERQTCCDNTYQGDRHQINSMNNHCRTLQHIAHLTGHDPKELQKACIKYEVQQMAVIGYRALDPPERIRRSTKKENDT